MAITSAAAVANAFLEIQRQDAGSFPPIDQLKIQKLVYYAQAWWLAYRGEPLFDEEIYAWPWGPVVPSLYGAFKDCGRSAIPATYKATEFVKTGEGPFSFQVRTPPTPPGEVMDFLQGVWQSHRDFSGTQLSNASHAPGEPWTVVKSQYGDLQAKPVIPNDLIRDVFQAKLNQ